MNSARPLWAGVRALEQRYGWAISYEDPQYSSGDLVEHPIGNASGARTQKTIRSGELDVALQGTEAPEVAVQALINDHNRRHNPGQFELKSLGGNRFVVLPVSGSVLDTPISLPERERSLYPLLSEMAQAISQATQISVHGPGMLSGALRPFRLHAENEPARNILLRAVETKTGPRLPLYVWDLRFAPDWGYVLDVHSVKVRAPLPDGSSTFKEVRHP